MSNTTPVYIVNMLRAKHGLSQILSCENYEPELESGFHTMQNRLRAEYDIVIP